MLTTVENTVKLLQELSPEAQLIAMGGIMALKAQQDLTAAENQAA